MLNPYTGDYTGTRTTGVENAVLLRLKTPLDSWLFSPQLGSKLHLLPRKDTEQTRALAEQYAWQALEPLIQDGRAQSVNVAAVRKRAGWLDLTIQVLQADGKTATFRHHVQVS